MRKTAIRVFSIILCASMMFLSACSTQTNEETENKNSNSLNDSAQTESSSRIEFKGFSDEDVAFENNTAFVNSQLLLTADERYTYDDINTQVEKLGGKIVGCIEFTNDYQIEFENADYNKLSDIQKQLSDYFENSSVELHKVFLLDGESNEYNAQYSNNGNWWREAVKLTDLEKESHTYQSVDVGVFDTVFDVNNQDLTYAFQNGEAINNETEKLKEENGHHGTNVSGFLAAQKNNNYGIDGTANNVNLYAYSYFGSGDEFTYFTSSMYYKYRIATLLSKNTKIINISLNDTDNLVAAQNGIKKAILDLKYYSDSLTVFLTKYINAGQEFVIVESAGNENGYTWIKCDVSSKHPYGIRVFNEKEDKDLSKFTQLDKITYDAKYDIMGAITDSAVKKRIIIVGSSDKTNNRADHSVNGERVDIYAPGIELKTLLDDENGAGTSYAAPITAGVTALIWGVNPDIKADDIKYLLTSSATVPIENEKYQINADSGDIIYMNKYLVNAQNAVKRAETYKTDKIPSANSSEGVLMGITRLYDNGNLSDFNGKCNISIYKSDTDDEPFKTIATDEYGEFFVNLSAGYYTLEAESADGVYRSDRLGFNIELSAVKYMDYLLISKSTNYTAEDLINKPVKDIVELMGETFDVDKYQSFFYNNDVFPGFEFYVDCLETDEGKLKETIKNNNPKLIGIQVNDSGAGFRYKDTVITADMDFSALSSVFGEMKCKRGTGALISGAWEGIAYTTEINNCEATINFDVNWDISKYLYSNQDVFVPQSEMKKHNPKIKNIAIVSKPKSYKTTTDKSFTEIAQEVSPNKYWVVFREGYRNSRVEMSTFDVNGDFVVTWNKNLVCNNQNGECNQFYYNNSTFEKIGTYNILTDYATEIIASNFNIYNKDGNIVFNATTSSIKSENAESAYTVYREKIEELFAKYGEAAVSNMGYYIGVPVVRLIDFDGDGKEELYCVYSENNPYYANKQEVFGYIDGTVVSLLKIDVENYGTGVEPVVQYLTCSDKTYLLTDSALRMDFSSSVWSELNANKFEQKISYSILNNGTTMNEDLIYTVDGKEVAESKYHDAVDSFIGAGTQTISFMSQSQDQENSIILITNETLELLGYTSSVPKWKQLYIDAVKNDRVVSDYVYYALVNVDNDGIPELVCGGNDVAHGTIIAWIKDGSVVNEHLGYSGFFYYPNENRFYASYLNHGIYRDTVYEFQNGSLVKMFEGEVLPKENGFSNPGWFINNEHISKDEYNSRFSSVFDTERSSSVKYNNRDEIISIINSY